MERERHAQEVEEVTSELRVLMEEEKGRREELDERPTREQVEELRGQIRMLQVPPLPPSSIYFRSEASEAVGWLICRCGRSLCPPV